MDYLLLTIACFFYSIQFAFQKGFQTKSKDGIHVSTWYLVTMYICMASYLLLSTGFIKSCSLPSIGYSLVYATAELVTFLGSLLAMQYGKISVVTTFNLLGGMVLPFFYGILFLQEPVTVWKVLGILVLIGSMMPAMFAKETADEKKKGHKGKFLFICLLVFCGNGFVSIASKAHQISPNAIDTDSFVMQNTLFCLLLSAIVLLGQTVFVTRSGDKHPLKTVFYEIGKTAMTGKLFVFLVIMAAGNAVCNGLGNIFSLRCALTMDSSIQYPLLSGAIIFLSAMVGRVLFREKIEKANAVSLLFTLVGTVLFIIPV